MAIQRTNLRPRKVAPPSCTTHMKHGTLQITYDLLENILDHVADPIFVKDRDHRIIYGNRALSKMIGLPPNEYLGKNDHEFFPKEQVEVFWAKDNKVLETGEVDLNEEYLTDSQGKIHILSTKKTRCIINGQDAVIVGITRDITAIKEIERMKNDFIAMISHELRTPLTSIHAALALLASDMAGDLPPAAETIMKIAYRNSERLVRLVNDMLDLEKIEAGMLHPHLEPIEVKSFLTQAIEENNSYGRKHGVFFEIGEVLTPCCILADTNRLMQVLANLLSNATKFSPCGSTVILSAATVVDNCVRIEVRDHGMGIPKQLYGTIFEKFTQGDSSSTRQQGGTGLGLNISKKLVEAMHGNISFWSEPGKGTCFYVDLPMTQQPPCSPHAKETYAAG